MEQIVKAFTGIFMALLLSFTGIGLINISIQEKNADEFINCVASQWEASNFMLSEDTLSANIPEGYDYAISTEKAVSKGNGQVSYALIKMKYTTRVPILGIRAEKEISMSLR